MEKLKEMLLSGTKRPQSSGFAGKDIDESSSSSADIMFEDRLCDGRNLVKDNAFTEDSTCIQFCALEVNKHLRLKWVRMVSRGSP